jgi:hypothetical protein
MTSRRYSFVALVLMAAVVSFAFSPLLSSIGLGGRQHPRTSFALTAPLILVQPVSGFLASSSTAPQEHLVRTHNRIELNCARLC